MLIPIPWPLMASAGSLHAEVLKRGAFRKTFRKTKNQLGITQLAEMRYSE